MHRVTYYKYSNGIFSVVWSHPRDSDNAWELVYKNHPTLAGQDTQELVLLVSEYQEVFARQLK